MSWTTVFAARLKQSSGREHIRTQKIFRVIDLRLDDDRTRSRFERRIDRRIGHLIKARRVDDLSVGGPTYTVPASKLLAPGTITMDAM